MSCFKKYIDLYKTLTIEECIETKEMWSSPLWYKQTIVQDNIELDNFDDLSWLQRLVLQYLEVRTGKLRKTFYSDPYIPEKYNNFYNKFYNNLSLYECFIKKALWAQPKWNTKSNPDFQDYILSRDWILNKFNERIERICGLISITRLYKIK